MQLLINPVDRPNGRTFAVQVFEMETNDAKELLDYARFQSRFDYVCGKKVYRPNMTAVLAIAAGKYRIKH